MHILFKLGIGFSGFISLLMLGLTLYALPATFSLPRGLRPGLENLTISKAAARLRKSEAEGWDLIERARLLVDERMTYSRRNSFDAYAKAFQRGYGYCQQSAFALARLLKELGFDARPVHCEQVRFPDHESPTGHAWVRVTYQGETREIDPGYQDVNTGKFLFEHLKEAKEYTPLFRFVSAFGCAVANAYRYYRTGSDVDANY